LFGAMAEMEATCARLAALSMTPLERRRLSSLHDTMHDFVANKDKDGFAAANRTFHLDIYQGAHNSVLADFATGLRRRLTPFRRAQFRAKGRLAHSHEEHAKIVEAILAGDDAAAHAAMFHHMSLIEESFERLAATV
jgi:DNA-binding GntR family transcriptional regulator